MSVLLALALVGGGVFIGVLAGFFGVGGGILMVPLMVLLLDASQHLAEGTSLMVIVPTAVAGVVAHARRGYVDLGAASLLAFGGIGGAYLGAWIAHRVSGETLQAIFAVPLVLMGIRLILQGAMRLRAPAPPPARRAAEPPELT